MSILPASGIGDESTGFYNGVATQSLRFDDGSSNYLTRTPSSAGSRTTWTWSGWFKIGTDPTLYHNLFTSNTNYDQIRFDPNSRIIFAVYSNNGATNVGAFTTKIEFRDMTNWYHFAFVWDTTNSTAGDRQRMYVNGKRILDSELTITATPSQNAVSNFNNEQMSIGRRESTNSLYLDGFMSEINFIDGTAITHTQNSGGDYILDELGELKNGVWIPKEYTGSYGTNGFRLEFKQTGDGSSTASSSTIGADTSGNDNHFKDLNFDASQSNLPDCPENNFCILNPLNANDHRGEASFSRSSLRMTSSSGNRGFTSGTMRIHGKVYFEVLSRDGNNGFVGINDITNSKVTNGQTLDMYNGTPRIDGVVQSNTGTFSDGDIMGVAVDVDAKSIEFFRNNSSVYSTTYTTDVEGGYFPIIHDSSGGRSSDFVANFGQDSSFTDEKTKQNNSDGNGQGDFYYTPPSGFLAMCSANLPDVTISPDKATQADDHHDTIAYSGSASNQIITTKFQADWLWFKERTTAGIDHNLFDSSRLHSSTGAKFGRKLESNSTDAESDSTSIVSQSGNDITLLGGVSTVNDASSRTYVMWHWKANGGTTSTNNDGSITSTVQANQTAGFSIVTYTGNGSTGTVGHGLGEVPAMIVIKLRGSSGGSWIVYHRLMQSTPEDVRMFWDSSDARGTSTANFNSTAPTSSVFSVGNTTATNGNDTYLAYCFAEIEGYSSFGSYAGNSNANGTLVHTGFRPAFLLGKKNTGVDNWYMYDNARTPHNAMGAYSLTNTTGAEATDESLDFLSNGFKWRINSGLRNASGHTYIYMAFADQPFKFSNAK